MRTEAKAANTKPDVSLNTAVGTLNMRADDLADAAILTAIYRAMYGKTGSDLLKAICTAAKEVAAGWQNEDEFVMCPPRRRAVK